MTILKELWSNEKNNVETQSVYEYVINLRNKLEKTCKLASENLVNAQNKQKSHFDVRAKQRTLEPDDLVLLLLPTDNNKLLMHWKGPFRVLERIGINDYRIQIADNTKIFHINMLKKFNKRAQADIAATVAVLDHMSDDDDDDLESVDIPHLTDINSQVNIGNNLSHERKAEMISLSQEFEDIFSDFPGYTNLLEHGNLHTRQETIDNIVNAPVPKTIKQVRAFLCLSGQIFFFLSMQKLQVL